jgi:hypothetical protein
MRFAIRTPTLLVLSAFALLATPQASAQEADPTRPKEAVVPKARALEIPVTGLASENSAAVKADLLALKTEVHVCKACEKEQPAPGTCPGCKGELEPESRALFSSVTASANLLTLSPDPLAIVRLSQIESTLGPRTVKIDEERFTLVGRSQLVVSSPPTESAAVERALKESKLFAEIKVEPQATANQLVLTVRAEAKAPTRAQVATALQGAQARLVDVQWRPIVPRS